MSDSDGPRQCFVVRRAISAAVLLFSLLASSCGIDVGSINEIEYPTTTLTPEQRSWCISHQREVEDAARRANISGVSMVFVRNHPEFASADEAEALRAIEKMSGFTEYLDDNNGMFACVAAHDRRE